MASSRTEGRAATAAQFAFNAWRCARMHPGRGRVIVRRIWAVVALAIAWQSATPALADEPEKEKVVWEVINPFSPCTGDCGIAALAGKSVSQTAMTSIFIRFEPPGTWQWDNSYLVSLSASRTLVRYGKYFSIDPEIGFAKRFGDASGIEGWFSVYVRWRYFPWSDYVRTSIGVGIGPSVASNVTVVTGHVWNKSGVGVANYFSPELELGIPSIPSIGLVVRFHHRSNVWGLFPDTSDEAQYWTFGFRAHF
jgi:hypothetical protein